MLLHQERMRLSELGVLNTKISEELYHKYYYTLFEFAKDLKNSNVEQIVIKDDSVVIRSRKENILLNCLEGEMTSALGQLIMAGTENAEQEMMTALLGEIIKRKGGDPYDTFFCDIGANIGWYSIYFGKKFKNMQIHAFEPIQTTYEQLLKNMKLNGSIHVRANNFGLADTRGTAEFYVCPSLLAASSLADTYQISGKTKVRAEIRTLDDYCHENDLTPDFIKCDVEGAELLVFKGAEKTLANAKPVVVAELLRKWSKCFEYHPNDVIELFRKNQFSCYTIEGDSLKVCEAVTDETVETNFFFLHDRLHRDLLGIHI